MCNDEGTVFHDKSADKAILEVMLDITYEIERSLVMRV